MKLSAPAILIAALFLIHVHALGRAGEERKTFPPDAEGGLVIPSPILKITSLEFRGMVSDLLFIKALVFEGSTYERKERPRIKPEEWRWLEKVLNASTDLDPYFLDPYFLANAHMTWEGGMVRETNTLLDKGIRYRDWDWLLPFFAGFNSFYFLQDNMNAAEYLMTASRRPGPSEQLASLASRLAFKEKKTENAILFLEAVAKKTEDERLKKKYETRILALQARLLLERSVDAYKKTYGRIPVSPQQMVERGILKEIPKDPYEGRFAVGPDGEISSTSDHLLMPKPR